MKRFLSCHSESEPSVLVEWDDATGRLRITEGRTVIVDNNGMRFSLGIANVGIVVWQGNNFAVMANEHDILKREFPQLTLEAEYLSADKWCSDKGKAPKGVMQFLTNWCKRAMGGKFARGGVQL